MHKELMELGDRLKKEGRANDAAIVYSAAFKLAPPPTPKYESLREVVPGFYLHLRQA